MCGTDPDSPRLTFTAGFSKANRGMEDEIESFLLETIEGIAKEGLPKDAVEAAIRRQEFKLQEIPGDGLPFGIATSLKAARSWLRGGTPEEGVGDLGRLASFKARMDDPLNCGRYLESWMLRNLVENPRRCLLTVEEDSSYDSSFKAALDGKIQDLRRADLIPSLQEELRFNSFVESLDSEQATATIGRISRDDLPLSVPQYKTQSIRTKGGARLYSLSLFTRSIVYVSMAFDTKGLSLGEKTLLPLLVRFLNMCGTKRHSYSQVGTAIKFLTGGFAINMTAGRDVEGRPVSLVMVKAKMLRKDTKAALDLIGDILLKADFSDHARIRATLTDLLTDYESGYTYSGNSYAVQSASSLFSSSALESELTVGTSCWKNLVGLRNDLESGAIGLGTLSERLSNLCSKVFVQRGLKFHLGCEEPVEECRQLALEHIDRYPIGKFVRTNYYYARDVLDMALYKSSRRFFQVSSGPAYNALAMKLPIESQKDLVCAMLLAWTMESGCLWDDVRGRIGAYGVECHVDPMEGLLVFSSYRDPCVDDTFKAFVDALSFRLDPQQVEYAVVSMIGRDIKPPTPQMKCSQSFRRVLYGLSSSLYRHRRALLLSLTSEDLKDFSDRILAKSLPSCAKVTVCGKDLAKGFVEAYASNGECAGGNGSANGRALSNGRASNSVDFVSLPV